MQQQAPQMGGKQRIEEAREAMADHLRKGGFGIDACKMLSRTYDELVSAFWNAGLSAIGSSAAAAERAGLAIVAQGGWGRQEMCPYSDIDFLLLADPGSEEMARELAETILYPLWDAKIKVGHAVRDRRSAAALAREDLPTATALLDARLIVGSPKAFAGLVAATRRSIAPGGNANAFVRTLQEERARRYERFGDSLYLLEPNIKHGVGGLRDVNTAHWAARARWSVPGISDLVPMGELTKRQARVMEKGLDVLLKLRCILQLEAGRGTDQLTFELQEAIGPVLYPYVTAPEGKVVPAVAPSVETLMRKYYLAGRGVERICSRILESATVPERRKPRISKIDRTFLVWNGKLACTDPAIFRDEPSEMLRYFRVALDQQVPLYGHTMELIEAQVARSGHLLCGDSASSELFLDALVDLRDRGTKSLLREMHAVGLLAAMIPEFGPCTGRVQHDLYHVYTVDHHQLFAVDLLKQTGRGELGPEGRVAMEAYQRVERLRPLYLATLLHDVGKPLGAGHAQTGAKIGANAASTLGMTKHEIGLVDFLIRQHLTMSHLSQRRDLSDPEVIEKFSELVQTEEALTMLFLLTRCDTAMTAPGNLTSWKDQLLAELYLRTLTHLRGGESMVESERAIHRRLARNRAVEILLASRQESDRERIETLIDGFEPSFVNSLNARQLAKVGELCMDRVDRGELICMHARAISSRQQTELICVSEDAPAVLSYVAGVFSAHRVVIDSASITSVWIPEGATAIQVFFVRDVHKRAIPASDRRWQRAVEDLRRVLSSDHRGELVAQLLASRKQKDDPFKPLISQRADSEVKIYDGESSEYSVIEVFTNDSLGLLHRIAGVLAAQGLDIHRSMLTTEGERVADVFYVQYHANRSKLAPGQFEEVREALLAVLGDGT